MPQPDFPYLKGEADRIARIVRNLKRVDLNTADLKRISRRKNLKFRYLLRLRTLLPNGTQVLLSKLI